MAYALHNSPVKLPTNTKTVTSKDVLMSCKTVEELERLTTQYAMITDLLQGLPEDPCDTITAAQIKYELLEIETALQTLNIATTEAEELKADLKSMMDYVKEHRLHENIDNYLISHIMRPLEPGSTAQKRRTVLPVANAKITHDKSARSRNVGKTAGIESDGTCCGQHDAGVRLDEDANDENSTPQLVGLSRSPQPASGGISAEEFLSVPEHIRGRLTVEKINETVEMLRDVMRLKYRLLRKRKGLTPLEKEAVVRMRSEIVPGVRECRFISEEDVYLFKQKKLPRSTLNHLVVLRHLEKIREVRDKNIVRIVLKC